MKTIKICRKNFMNPYLLIKRKKYKCSDNKSQTYSMETEVSMNKLIKLSITFIK